VASIAATVADRGEAQRHATDGGHCDDAVEAAAFAALQPQAQAAAPAGRFGHRIGR
jgi:hypothetical protein